MSKTPTLGDGAPVDLARLIETRGLVQANSGAGKSWLLRRLLEQTHGQVQQIVLDTEGEFATLRERFDYIICAPRGADAVATPATAKLLARRLLEAQVSAVVDIYDLKAHDRVRFVRLFLESVNAAPRTLWHPALIVLDEAHRYIPQAGQAESAPAVIDLCTAGRKKGFCALLATQRLSKLHKDAAAELLNKAVGRTGLDVDVRRATDELGIVHKEAVTELRQLQPGEFFLYGPAFSDNSVRKVKVGGVETTHPKVGERALAAPPAPSDAVREALAKLADLPQQAEAEVKTVEDLRRENAGLKREVARLQKEQPAPEIRVEEHTVEVVDKSAMLLVRDAQVAVRLGFEAVKEAAMHLEARGLPLLDQALDQAEKFPPASGAKAVKHPPTPKIILQNPRQDLRPAQASAPQNGDGPKLHSGAVRILKTLAAKYPATYTRAQVGALTSFKVTGGTFQNYWSALKKAGLIVEQNREAQVTEAGLAYLGDDVPPRPATHEEVMALWREALVGRSYDMLEIVIDERSGGISRGLLAERVDMTVTGGTYQNYLSILRRNGLIEERGGAIYPADILWPEGV